MLKHGRWRCAVCRYQVSLTAGTILHNTKIPLTVWFGAAYLMTMANDIARHSGGLHRPADHHATRVDHPGRPRKLQLGDVVGRYGAVAHLREIFGGVP